MFRVLHFYHTDSLELLSKELLCPGPIRYQRQTQEYEDGETARLEFAFRDTSRGRGLIKFEPTSSSVSA